MFERAIEMIAELPDKFTQQDLIPILDELESLDVDNKPLVHYLEHYNVQLWIFDPLNKLKITQLIEIIDEILGGECGYYLHNSHSDEQIQIPVVSLDKDLSHLGQAQYDSDLVSKHENELYSDIAPENDYPSNEADVGQTHENIPKSESNKKENTGLTDDFEQKYVRDPKRISFLDGSLESHIQILDRLFEFQRDTPKQTLILNQLKKDPVVDIFGFKIYIPLEIVEYFLGDKTIRVGLQLLDQIDTRFLLRIKRIPQILLDTKPIVKNFDMLVGKLKAIRVIHVSQFTMRDIIIGKFDLHLQDLKFLSEVSKNPSYKLIYSAVLQIPVIIQRFTVYSGLVDFDLYLEITFTDHFRVYLSLKARKAFKKRLERNLKKHMYNYICNWLTRLAGIVRLFTTMNDFMYHLFCYLNKSQT